MTRNEIISELLGDYESDFIANRLQDLYNTLEAHSKEVTTLNSFIPIYSSDREEELEEIIEFQEALELVHSWYSHTPLVKD